MATDRLRDLQDQLNRREADLQRSHIENSRLSSSIQDDSNDIVNKYQNEQGRIRANINTINNDVQLMQKDIATLQKKQTSIQQKITEYQKLQATLQKEVSEYQEQQTAIQRKMKEKQDRLGDYTKKMEGLLRDQSAAEQKVKNKQRELEQRNNETRVIERGVATLRADLAREMANIARQNQANRNSAPSTDSRKITSLRRF